MQVVGGSGHRPLKLAESYEVFDLTKNILVNILREKLVELEADLVKSGGAVGFDTCLSAAAHREGIPFDVIIPSEEQKTRYPKPVREEYERMLSCARKVIIPPACMKTENYRERLLIRNEVIADESTTLIALWDRSKYGGTYHCVRYFERTRPGETYINLWDKWVTESGVFCGQPKTLCTTL
jgi:uncharacterized phage-like protein YoqJ